VLPNKCQLTTLTSLSLLQPCDDNVDDDQGWIDGQEGHRLDSSLISKFSFNNQPLVTDTNYFGFSRLVRLTSLASNENENEALNEDREGNGIDSPAPHDGLVGVRVVVEPKKTKVSTTTIRRMEKGK
jgi:hypothetical protein